MFGEIGCTTKIEYTIDLVRGRKEVDVYVEDNHTVPKSIYLCECKHWKRPVTQEVIHGFRTVLADFGANRGFIISNAGFQKGAIEASSKTNIDLVTFKALQEIFFDRWVEAMVKRLMPYSDRLFPYWDYSGGKQPKIPWTDEHRRKLLDLNYRYSVLIDIGPKDEYFGFQKTFPSEVPDPMSNAVEKKTVTVKSYRQYFDLAFSVKDIALEEYKTLFGEGDA